MNFVNYNSLDFQAIEVLERATRVRPVAPLFILLGKTNMKAKRFEDAIKSFDRAIEIMVCSFPLRCFFMINVAHASSLSFVMNFTKQRNCDTRPVKIVAKIIFTFIVRKHCSNVDHPFNVLTSLTNYVFVFF